MLTLYNTLTRAKAPFTPIDPANVRLYVCGPTVYDLPHLGNARSVVVYDVLFRLLRHLYGEQHVSYVRNITDVDDKINAAAKASGEPISTLTERVTQWFHDDMAALGCLPPTEEPRATRHIASMIAMIGRLITNGHAYESQGHVLFSVASDPHYGRLSGRKQADLIAGARVEVESYKRAPGDFVLWKPAHASDDASSVFESPWGKGRPGWHIECSAMSVEYFGAQFDIHGGGADLMFPHHENEIAQSCGAYPGTGFANVWVHNGFLTVNGEKMSKSLGNFTTVRDVLSRGVKGEVIRLALLSTYYRNPLDWNEKLVDDARKTLDGWYRRIDEAEKMDPEIPHRYAGASGISAAYMAALEDDLNIPRAVSLLHEAPPSMLRGMGSLLGLLQQSPTAWFKGDGQDDAGIEELIEARKAAKAAKNFAEADRIRQELVAQGIILEDKPGGITQWRKG